MLKHHEQNRTESTIEPRLSPTEPGTSSPAIWRNTNTGLHLIETSRRSDPRPTSGPGRPWFAIAAGLLCWLAAGLLIAQL